MPALDETIAIGPHAGTRLCLGLVSDAATIQTAYDAGVRTFFVSADLHWGLYEATRTGLRQLMARGIDRDGLVILGTSYVRGAGFMAAAFQDLLNELPELQRLDILVAGGLRLADYERAATDLELLVRHDLCGATATGATFHDRPAAMLAANGRDFDIVFGRYNPLHTGMAKEVFPHLRPRTERAPVFVFNSTVGRVPRDTFEMLGLPADIWAPEVADYYRFALTPECVDGLLAAPQTPRELSDLCRALREPPLKAFEQQHLVQLAQLVYGRRSDEMENGYDASVFRNADTSIRVGGRGE